MISIGGIVSVGGSGGSSGGGSGSGIQSINAQTGPAIAITGVNGINISAGGNIITVNGAALSGLIPSPDGSGINAVNGDRGPNIDLIGVNGIQVTPLGNGQILLNGIALSGISGGSSSPSGTTSCYSASFTGILSQTFTHGLNTLNVIAEVYDSNGIAILPDDITIVDVNSVTLSFNRPATGRVVILGCGNCCSQSGVVGVNGITVAQVGGNFVVDATPLSGLITASALSKFSASFSNIVSGQFTHGLNTRDVLVQVYEESPLALQIVPDEILRDSPSIISLIFNRPQSGRVVVIG